MRKVKKSQLQHLASKGKLITESGSPVDFEPVVSPEPIIEDNAVMPDIVTMQDVQAIAPSVDEKQIPPQIMESAPPIINLNPVIQMPEIKFPEIKIPALPAIDITPIKEAISELKESFPKPENHNEAITALSDSVKELAASIQQVRITGFQIQRNSQGDIEHVEVQRA